MPGTCSVEKGGVAGRGVLVSLASDDHTRGEVKVSEETLNAAGEETC